MSEKQAWFERKQFWQDTESILFNRKRLAEAAAEVERMVKLLGIEPPAEILDLCCGVGRHSLELARRGFKVTGVDLSQGYVTRARNKAKSDGLKIDFVQADMRTFSRPQAFDAVINLFSSFGYFEDPEDDRAVVLNAYRSLQAGGKFLLDLMGKEVLARDFRVRDWQEVDGYLVLEEREISDNWSHINSHWIIFKNGQRREHDLTLRIYSAAELTALLTDCGFSKISIYGDLQGRDYDHRATRLIAVAQN